MASCPELTEVLPPKDRIALLVSAANLNKSRGTYNALYDAIQADPRYNGRVRVELKAWDEDAAWEQYSHIVFAAGLTYATNYTQFTSWLRDLPYTVRERMFNPLSIIKWNMNKKYLKELKEKGIRIPPTVFIKPLEQPLFEQCVVELEEEKVGDDPLQMMVLKSMVDAGGHSVVRIELDEMEASRYVYQGAIRDNLRFGTIFQQFQPFVNIEGEWSLIYFDRRYSHAILKSPELGDFRVQTRFGGKYIPFAQADIATDILEFGAQVIAAIEGTLVYARVDIVRNMAKEPTLMEVELFEPDLYLSKRGYAENFLEAILKY